MLFGGIAALSWEVIWQLELGLSLGVSAEGTALTLACMMGGMSLGAWLMGRVLEKRAPARPLRWYAVLELLVGLSGLALRPALAAVARADAGLAADASASPLHVIGLVLVLGLPTCAMGASLPLFGLVARQYGTKLSHLYGLNTLGAAIGTLVLALVVMPALGVGWSVALVSAIDLSIFALAFSLPAAGEAPTAALADAKKPKPMVPALAGAIVLVTGLATFALEVAWFRALRAAYFSTTYTFAILVAAVLVPIALAARVAPWLRSRGGTVGPWLAASAVAILIATPIVERFDALSNVPFFFFLLPSWFLQTLLVVGPAMFLLGIALPWVLEDQAGARGWGALYAVNTIGAIGGALLAAWVLLPSIGIARTAWLVGGLVALVALAAVRGRTRMIALGATVVALGLAITFESGVGRTRTIGAGPGKLLAFRESADFTVSVVEQTDGTRQLYIDGFVATSEAGFADYMVWMGRLPALLHPKPGPALVICFGTGQTANALRREHVESLDIVDISQAVFDLAGQFPKNEGVLDDPIVHHHRVDGRSWLRRTKTTYDVITLEPMPPTFAGVNALYSREFYELVHSRLNPGGIAAQWLPFHLVDPLRGASIATTFRAVFPNAVLWVHPSSGTGILLGKNDASQFGTEWPGLDRESPGRTLTNEAIRTSLIGSTAFTRYADAGKVITDDNQLLAYGFDPRNADGNFGRANAAAHAKLLDEAAQGPIRLPPPPPFEPLRWVFSFVTILVAIRLTFILRRDLRRRFASSKGVS